MDFAQLLLFEIFMTICVTGQTTVTLKTSDPINSSQEIVTKQGSAFGIEYSQHATRLIQTLTDKNRYDARIRPSEGNVKIVMRLSLYQLLDVMEPTQTIVVYMWVTQMWTDNFLGWYPEKFGGINWIVLPYDEVWRPDTYLYNSVQMSRSESERWINVIVNSKVDNETGIAKGSMRFMYPAIYKFSCKLFVRYFPFDKQNCTMIFGSWTNDMSGIDFELENDFVLLENFIENEEWKIISFEMQRKEMNFTCCPDPWVLLHAHLVMQRKPLHYLVNLVLPSAVITLVAIVGFFMPASTTGERSEKVNLGITTLLAMAILLLMVADDMPTTSNFIPLLGVFYLNVILLTSVGTLLTSIVIWLQNQAAAGKPVWDYIRRPIFHPVARWLKCAARAKISHAPLTGCATMREASEQEDIEGINYEWEHLANILDRVLLIIFTVATFTVTGMIFVTGNMLREE